MMSLGEWFRRCDQRRSDADHARIVSRSKVQTDELIRANHNCLKDVLRAADAKAQQAAAFINSSKEARVAYEKQTAGLWDPKRDPVPPASQR
jgi:hypothetical protein